MIDLQGQKGEVTFTLHVTSKETGIENTFRMVGILDDSIEPVTPLTGEPDGSDPLVSST
jgi:hypothetical protein